MTNNHLPLAAPEEFTTNVVAQLLLPIANSYRSTNFNCPPDRSMASTSLLMARAHLHDCTSVGLDWRRLERHLIAFTGGGGRMATHVRGLLGTVDLMKTAKELAVVAETDPDLVVAALEGRLDSAASMVPAQGIGRLNRAETLGLIVQVGYLHIVRNTLRAARLACSRLHQPTGHAMLDANGEMAPTVGSAASALHAIAVKVAWVLDLERTSKDRALSADETMELEALVEEEDADRVLAALRAAAGSSFDTWLSDELRYARRWTKYIRKSTEALQNSKSLRKKPLYNWYDTAPMARFLLTLLQTCAWVRQEGQDLKQQCPLEDAVYAIAHDSAFVLPSWSPADVPMARELFYVLRNFYMMDYNSTTLTLARQHPGVDHYDLATRDYRKHSRYRTEAEPFRNPNVATAAFALDRWAKNNRSLPAAIALGKEMNGSILVQLRS